MLSPRRWKRILVLTLAVGLTSAVAAEEGSTGATPSWTRAVRLADGRTFVTDGSLSIDAALAKPAAPPERVLGEAAAKIVQGYLTAPLPDEVALEQLAVGPGAGTYTAPSGVVLNAKYVDYLRRLLPARQGRLRMKGDLDPVVILRGTTAVGVVMPMRR